MKPPKKINALLRKQTGLIAVRLVGSVAVSGCVLAAVLHFV